MSNFKLAVYCRVSTLDQKKNETITRQITANSEKLKTLLREHGGSYDLFSRSPLKAESDLRRVFFCDEGYNLENLDHETALSELLQLIQEGRINAVLIDLEDRLFRSKKRMVRAYVQDILEEHDVKVYTHRGQTPHGMLLDITSAISAADKREIARKLAQGKMEKMKREGGPMNNRVAFGYRWNKKKAEWETLPEEAKIVRWAVAATSGKINPDMPESIRMLIDEHPDGVPDLDLIDALSGLGFSMRPYYLRTNMVDELDKNPTGRLHEKFLYRLLRDRKYIGGRTALVTPANLVGRGKSLSDDKKECIPMGHPALVTESEWHDMERARTRRAKFYGKNNQHPYLIQQIAICAHCGSHMQSASSFVERFVKRDGVERKYRSFSYKCNNRKPNARNRCGVKNNHVARLVDEAAWRKVVEYIVSPDMILQNEKVVREDITLNNVIQRLETELKSVCLEILQTEEQEGRMLDNLARQVITEEQFKSFSKKAHDETFGLKRIKKKIEIEIEAKRKLIRSIERIDLGEIRSQYLSRLAELSFPERRSIALRVIRRVVLSASGVDYIDFFLPTSTQQTTGEMKEDLMAKAVRAISPRGPK